MLEASKLKGLADDNFKFDDNGRKFSEWVENAVGKGEIAHYKQFLLFSLCFQKTYAADMWKPELVLTVSVKMSISNCTSPVA